MNATGHKLYSKLCHEYNDQNWQTICGFDQFLKSKLNRAINKFQSEYAEQLQEVIRYAENDF